MLPQLPRYWRGENGDGQMCDETGADSWAELPCAHLVTGASHHHNWELWWPDLCRPEQQRLMWPLRGEKVSGGGGGTGPKKGHGLYRRLWRLAFNAPNIETVTRGNLSPPPFLFPTLSWAENIFFHPAEDAQQLMLLGMWTVRGQTGESVFIHH